MSDPTPPADTTETNDVVELMRPLYREYDEPRDGFEPVPVWLTIIFGALFFWGGWYIAHNTGNFRADVYDQPYPTIPSASNIPESPEEVMELGRKLYMQCALCHQPDGTGLEGVHPPLKGADWVIGDRATPERLAKLTLFGGIGEFTVNGVKYTAPMPAYGAQWKDHEIAAVLTYIRASWGNQATPVTPAHVAAVRQAEPTRLMNGSKGYTMAELLAK
jgi:mono/diheme cytochrome c family protein